MKDTLELIQDQVRANGKAIAELRILVEGLQNGLQEFSEQIEDTIARIDDERRADLFAAE